MNPSPKFGSFCDNCLTKFTIHFRRGDDYTFDGSFGFDWFRFEYENPMIQYKLGNQNAFEAAGDLSKISPGVEGSLSTLKKTYTTGQQSTISPFGIEYIPAWLAIPISSTESPHKVRLHLELIPINSKEYEELKDDGTKLIFESSNPNIIVEPSELPVAEFIYSQNSRQISKVPPIDEVYYSLGDTFSIECKALLSKHEEINVYAIKGETKEKVGKLMVYNNAIKPKMKITLVNIIIDGSTLNRSFDYDDFLKNKSFNQALIDVSINKDLIFDIRKFRQSGNIVDRCLRSVESGDTTDFRSFIFYAIEQYFDKNYKNKRYIFIVNKPDSTAAGICREKTVLLYSGAKNGFNHVLTHELGHSLNLPHIFKENPKSGVNKQDPNKKFTFIERSTTNFMDYSGHLMEIEGSHKVAIYGCGTTNYFFKYQWDIMRKALGV